MTVFDLPRRKGLAGDSLLSILKSSVKDITGDRGVKVEIVSGAIENVTGIAPEVDTHDPKVTWVRLRPQHGDYLDAVLFKSTKKIASGKDKGKPADMKIDVMPAAWPLIIKRVLPVIGIIFVGGFAVGYMAKKKR